MRITRTIRADTRAEIAALVRGMPDGGRITFEDPEASAPHLVRMRIMLEELARRVDWYGRRLTAREWQRVFLAAVRAADIVPGVEEGTAYILFEKNDAPSVVEASCIIELAYKLAAERGFTFSEG